MWWFQCFAQFRAVVQDVLHLTALSQERSERKHVACFTFPKFQAKLLRAGRHKTLFFIRPISSPGLSLESLSQMVHLYTKDDRPNRNPQAGNEPSILPAQRDHTDYKLGYHKMEYVCNSLNLYRQIRVLVNLANIIRLSDSRSKIRL